MSTSLRILAFLAVAAVSAEARRLQVGPGRPFAKPMAAAAQAASGDTVDIEAGAYPDEAATWRADGLVLRGVGGMARLSAPAVIPNGKAIWVIQGRNAVVERIEFRGAKVPDRNGAGIRAEGDGLTVRHCVFAGNENGILGGGSAASEVRIEHSEFSGNGHGDGYSHNLYISAIASLTVRFCDSHHARVGHNLKSRARRNLLLYNRIWDGADGASSMAVDLPNGGTSILVGNVIQQGPATENSTLIAYGAEGMTHPGKDLHLVNNTLVNGRPGGGIFVAAAAGATVRSVNNIYAGPGTRAPAGAESLSDWSGSDPGFRDPALLDFRIAAGSPAADAGRDPGEAGGMSLAPAFQYVPVGGSMPRSVQGTLDAGAYEAGAEFPTALRGGGPKRLATGMAGRPVDAGGRAARTTASPVRVFTGRE